MGQSMGYTPGPWQTELRDMMDGRTQWLILSKTGRKIASVNRHARQRTEKERSNAALIAAAPRLLEALRAIVDQWEQIGDVGAAAFAEGRDAVTQATGN
jgi:hypothetical protein